MNKNILIFTVLICSTLLSVSCSKEKQTAETKDGKTVITFACKDLNPSDPPAVRFISSVEKGLEKEGVNVKIELIEMPQAGYQSKLMLMLVSGKVPDIIYFQNGGDDVMARQGLLENLLPYVKADKNFEKYITPYNMKRLENFPYLLRIAPPETKVPVIRKDWLKKLGMGTPKTLDDYYKIMKKISETDMNGDGKKDTYAISDTGNTDRIDQIFNQAFGITSTWLKEKDGNYIYYAVSENEKNKLAFYRKLFKEKILDNEYITTRWDTFEDKFYSGKLAVGMATNGKVVDMYNERMKKVNGDDAELAILPPPYGIAQGFKATDVTKESRGYAVSALSKHKDLAFKVLAYLITEDGLILDNIGLEGDEYNYINGKMEVTAKAKTWYSRFFEPPTWQPPAKLLSDPALESRATAMKYYSEDNSFIIPGKFATKWDALTTLYKEYSYKIISGEYPISKFDDFVKEWYAEGGKQVTEYANELLKNKK